MTRLTPTFTEQLANQGNGAAGEPLHVTAAHEPTREGERLPARPPLTIVTPPIQSMVQPKPLKVALIGTAPSSRMLAPFKDPDWQIWACSPGNMNALPRVDLWFELHSNLLWPEHESYGRPYIEWLKQQNFPVYMQDTSQVPNALVFPKDELVEEFGDDFFTSSFSWMMALAIRMGAAEIALYGIDMASRDEYIKQRPGFYYFRLMARKRGIKVSAPHESDIMQSPPLYAYVDSTPFGRKIMARRQEITGRISGLDQQINQGTQNKVYLQGALEDLDYFESIWSGVSNDMSRLAYENGKLRQHIAELEIAFKATRTPFEPVEVNAPAEKKIRRRRRKKAEMPESPPAEVPSPAVTESYDG